MTPGPQLAEGLAAVTLQPPLTQGSGHLLVRAGMASVYDRLLWFALAASLIMAASLALAWMLSAGRRRRIYRAERACSARPTTMPSRGCPTAICSRGA